MTDDDLYVVYWVDEQGFAGDCEFVRADSLEAAREISSYASGGVAHQRLLFEGSFDEFREYVEDQLGEDEQFTITTE